MASHESDLEILVHVTAPSRAIDDVAYRQLARAYLAFEPQTRTELVPSQPPEEVRAPEDAHTAHQLPHVPPSSNEELLNAAPAHVFLIDSQDLSFESAIDNRSSPLLGNEKSEYAQLEFVASSQPSQVESQEAWAPPASQISDSYPLPGPGLSVSPTRVLESYLGRSSAPTVPLSSPSGRRQQKHIMAQTDPPYSRVDVPFIPSSIPIPASQAERIQAEWPELSEAIPVTPVVLKPLVRKRSVEAEDLVAQDVTHISATETSLPLATSSFRSESAPPSSKRPKTTKEAPDPAALARSSSDTGPPRPSSTPVISQHLAMALEVWSPSPPVGVGDLNASDLVPEKLAKLAKDLHSRYRPDATREVEPLERGYWLVDCTTWNTDTMCTAWAFLTNYLHKGHAGWGVWCRRDAAHEWLRLYCWGHVAEHTYLLLYLASSRHLKTTGAEWHGADGEVAVTVSPFERPA